MKRKVQAQRKFAQGAYIPPSVSSNAPAPTPPEKRPDATAEHRNVFYNTMSANSLLDIVAFQKIHTHTEKEAVVILERIENKKQAPTPPATKTVERNNNREARRPQRSSAAAAQKNNMQLRSRIRMNFKTFKPVILKRKKHNKIMKNKRAIKKRKVPSQADSYDLDDDKPLKYFARRVRRSESIATDIIRLRRFKRPREKDPSRIAQARKRILVTPIIKRPYKLASRQARPLPQAKASLRSATKTDEPETEDQQSVDFDDAATTASETLPLKPPTRVFPSPAQFNREGHHHNCAAISKKSVAMHEEACKLKSPQPSTSRFYSSRERLVEGWLDNAQQRDTTMDANFKVPLVPPRRRPEAPMEPSISNNSREPSPCPSERYTNVRDIVDAPDSDLSSRCALQKCNACQRVSKVRMLKQMVEIPLHTSIPNTDDVYEFDAEKDDAMENPRLYNFRQNRKAGKQHDMPPSTSDDETPPLYLDILPKSNNLSDHIIQILPKKLPNQSKPIMTARLVPKSESVMSNQFSLIEHEHMLDQLTKMNASDLSEIFDGIVEGNIKKKHEERRLTEGDLSARSPKDVGHCCRRSNEEEPWELEDERNLARLRIDEQNERSKEAHDRDLPRPKEWLQKTKTINTSRSNDDENDLCEQNNKHVNLPKSKICKASKTKQHSGKRPKEKGRKGLRTTDDVNGINEERSDGEEATTSKDVDKRNPSSTNKVSKRIKADGRGKITNRPAEKANSKKGQKRRIEPHKKQDHGLIKKSCKGRYQEANESGAGCSAWDSASEGIAFANRQTHVLEAPVFYPTEAEFNDPLMYIEKIMMTASKYGLCKVVAPPGFKPQCHLSDEIRFNVANQYIARLYSRWGPAAREMCAIKSYLASQSVLFSRSPLFEGIEVNLPKLYHIVQRNGGLKNVIEKKRWGRVAEEMRFTRGPHPEKRVDQLYVKYLLPYDTLATKERQEMLSAVENYWTKKNKKLLERALNPLHRQKRLLGESESSGEDTEDEGNLAWALSEAEDCVVSGRNMNLSSFKRVAANAMDTLFPRETAPCASSVEEEYWRLVLHGTDHVCVNTASIDTGDAGYGFTKNKEHPHGRHPWNLKMLSQNSGNVLRSLGPVLGVTVPTLHLGMVFSTSCWHRDPHGLPWIEYMHSGPTKIWYGIPDEQSDKFRRAVETLCPTSCQNKSIWLPSDITMIPPNLLREHMVSLSRIEQNPGEYIIVFPKAYSCSICTGYTLSESVYFATNSWLKSVTQVFQEVRDSCEPTMFSLEQLLISVARDPRSPLRVLPQVHHNLSAIVTLELEQRRELAEFLPPPAEPNRQRNSKKRPAGAWNVREQDECEICRTTLYLSKVTGLTRKRASVCLTHALRLLDVFSTSGAELVVFYTAQELEDVLTTVQNRLLV